MNLLPTFKNPHLQIKSQIQTPRGQGQLCSPTRQPPTGLSPWVPGCRASLSTCIFLFTFLPGPCGLLSGHHELDASTQPVACHSDAPLSTCSPKSWPHPIPGCDLAESAPRFSPSPPPSRYPVIPYVRRSFRHCLLWNIRHQAPASTGQDLVGALEDGT